MGNSRITVRHGRLRKSRSPRSDAACSDRLVKLLGGNVKRIQISGSREVSVGEFGLD